VQSGQRPKSAAIAYEFAIGKGGSTAMATKASDREKRRAAALRANLQRRKAADRMGSGRTTALTGELDLKLSPDGPNKTPKTG
jgi:hypothetical protein